MHVAYVLQTFGIPASIGLPVTPDGQVRVDDDPKLLWEKRLKHERSISE
jgi:hypothetical protein